MRKYLFCEAGFVEKANWQPNCWINIECPDAADFHFLQEQLKVPQSFLNDIADTDERPRTDDNKSLRLYVTTIPTEYRFHTFLEDPVYRISIATQNVAYNQPTQPGFYIGPELKGTFRGYTFK